MSTEFSIKMPDKHGYVPNLALLGTKHRHFKNGKIYTISGFVYMGETDEWGSSS